MSDRTDKRRKARLDYINRRMTLASIATVHGVSEATIGRWKRAAKDQGDDWDVARSAHALAGHGVEAVASSVIEDYFIQAQAVIAEIKNGALSPGEKVDLLSKLADATVKMSAAAKRFAPNISELGVAQDVIAKLLEFVRTEFPQHASVMLEILEPFSEGLVGAYAP